MIRSAIRKLILGLLDVEDNDPPVLPIEERLFVSNMIKIRHARKLTQAQLAEAIHQNDGHPITREIIAHIESGRRRVWLSDSYSIARALGCPDVRTVLDYEKR